MYRGRCKGGSREASTVKKKCKPLTSKDTSRIYKKLPFFPVRPCGWKTFRPDSTRVHGMFSIYDISKVPHSGEFYLCIINFKGKNDEVSRVGEKARIDENRTEHGKSTKLRFTIAL